MFLATPGMVPAGRLLLATIAGIGWSAGAAAAINCLVEQKIDALMRRTAAASLPRGQLSASRRLTFAGVLGGGGLWCCTFW